MANINLKICQHKKEDRRRIIDACVRGSHGGPVLVEYSWNRTFEDSRAIVGTLVGSAYMPGGSASEVLVVQPVDKRLHALSFAQVLRISFVTVANTRDDERDWLTDAYGTYYRLGEVLAGPQRKDAR